MTGKKTAVFGIYQNEKQAERTVEDLLAAGFSNDDISVLLPDNKGTKDFAHDKSTKAPEGATAALSSARNAADSHASSTQSCGQVSSIGKSPSAPARY